MQAARMRAAPTAGTRHCSGTGLLRKDLAPASPGCPVAAGLPWRQPWPGIQAAGSGERV